MFDEETTPEYQTAIVFIMVDAQELHITDYRYWSDTLVWFFLTQQIRW